MALLQQSYGRFGGAERLFFSHYIQLKKMKKDVTLFYTGRISDGWAERLKGEAIHPIPSGIPTNFRKFRQLLRFLSRLRNFDKIIIHHHVEPLLAYYISRFLGPKTIWYSGSVFELPWEEIITGLDYRLISPTVGRTATEFYGPLISRFLLSNSLYRITTETVKAVDIATVRGYGKILANSLFLSRFLARVYNLKKNPTVVYPGVDPLFERLSSERPSVEEDYVLAVGSLVPLKNFEGIIRAASVTRSSKIVFLGDGQDRNRLKKIAAELDVPIEFRGNYDQESDIARAYSQCKFLVLLSLYETFGLTSVEAGLFSKPSIVTNRGGSPETVIDGVTGYVVNPLDYENVSKKMNQLLGDDSLRRRMGEGQRKNVVENFTVAKSTEQLLSEVESMTLA
jgi:glycosyltransferase involved in cell wall biosynthesis